MNMTPESERFREYRLRALIWQFRLQLAMLRLAGGAR